MKFGYYRIALQCFLLAAFLSMSVSADINDKYNVSVGTSLISFDSHVTFNSHDNSIGEEIDLEDDLGLDRDLQAGWLSGMWRLTERHRVRASYVPFRRSSFTKNQSNIDVGDNTIKAGAFIDSSFKTEIFDIEYLYSFHKTPEWESSIGLGLYWIKSRSSILAEGVIINDADGSEEFHSSFQATQTLSVPLPLVGLSTSYELNSNIRFHGTARYLDVEINGIAGHVTSLSLRTDYYFSDHVGAGLSLTSFYLTVNRNGIILKNDVSWDYKGAEIFLVLRY